jgi:hypothetical protein
MTGQAAAVVCNVVVVKFANVNLTKLTLEWTLPLIGAVWKWSTWWNSDLPRIGTWLRTDLRGRGSFNTCRSITVTASSQMPVSICKSRQVELLPRWCNFSLSRDGGFWRLCLVNISIRQDILAMPFGFLYWYRSPNGEISQYSWCLSNTFSKITSIRFNF